MRQRNPEKAANLREEEDVMDQGEPDVMMQIALVMSIFPQYTLQDLLSMPLLEAELLMEQADYLNRTRMYLDRLNALTGRLPNIM